MHRTDGVWKVDDRKDRHEQERVEHAVDVDVLAVQRRQKCPVDEREREPLVEQLVGHHRPVGDAPTEDGERDR